MEPSVLCTVRSVSNKYHVELCQMEVDGGGAGEVEERMMWYTVDHAKGDGHLTVC
jgi:hypothetical protein